MAKDDNYYLSKISENIDFIIKYMSHISPAEFTENLVLQDSMMFRLIQISENAAKLSAEYLDSRKDVPWTAMKGLRNRIVHDYGSVDLSVVYDTLTQDIPYLKKIL